MSRHIGIREARRHFSRLLAGCIEVPDDFNSPLGPQVLADFEDPAPSRPWSSRDGC